MRLGIDIGGTKTAALVLDDSGGIVAQVAAPSGQGNTQVLATAARVADRAATLVGGWSHIDHLGACMPGLVDRRSGWARHAVNLGVVALDLAGGIEAATGRRPSIDNDVKAAALGAHHAVRPEVADGTTAYLNVGTGLAAAIVHRGEVVRGAGGAGGRDRPPAGRLRGAVLVLRGGLPRDHRVGHRPAPDVARAGGRPVPRGGGR